MSRDKSCGESDLSVVLHTVARAALLGPCRLPPRAAGDNCRARNNTDTGLFIRALPCNLPPLFTGPPPHAALLSQHFVIRPSLPAANGARASPPGHTDEVINQTSEIMPEPYRSQFDRLWKMRAYLNSTSFHIADSGGLRSNERVLVSRNGRPLKVINSFAMETMNILFLCFLHLF